jgi:hypothetical protein
MQKKKLHSQSELGKLGIPEADLRREWKEQIRQQTRPLARKSLYSDIYSLFLYICNLSRPIENPCTEGS